MNVRILERGDAEAYQSLRLAGLQECPSAFASSFAEESGLGLDVVAERLSPSADGVVLGAFADADLAGMVGVHREPLAKQAHKANVWGMYVGPAFRQAGIGRALLAEALAHAAGRLHAKQVNLGVNSRNVAAVRLYERLGFRQFGYEPAFMLLEGVAHDEIHMVCYLHNATWPHRPPATMAARLDHITVVAPSLVVGAAYVEATLGVPPGPGRTHPGMATHNLLLALGSDVYLEVISPDPGAAPVGRPRWFGLDHVLPGSNARLAAWVASTDDIAQAAVSELGDVETMRRETHTWKMTVRADGSVPLDGAVPLLIQRASSARPAAALPQNGLHLQRLRIRHPAPSQVLALLARIGLAPEPAVTVTQGDKCSLVAEIQTPFGPRELGEI